MESIMLRAKIRTVHCKRFCKECRIHYCLSSCFTESAPHFCNNLTACSQMQFSDTVIARNMTISSRTFSCYWLWTFTICLTDDYKQVQRSRVKYLTSIMFGHAKAQDVVQKLPETLELFQRISSFYKIKSTV